MRFVVAIVALAGLSVFAGCAGTRPDPADNPLIGTAWEVLSIDPAGPDLIVIHDPEHYIVQFRDAEHVAVRADCNECEGRYHAGGRAIALRVECETTGCAPGSNSRRVLAMLNGVTSFKIAGGGKHLFLDTDAESTVLSLRQVE